MNIQKLTIVSFKWSLSIFFTLEELRMRSIHDTSNPIGVEQMARRENDFLTVLT